MAAGVSIQWEPSNDPKGRFILQGLPTKAVERVALAPTNADTGGPDGAFAALFRVYTVIEGRIARTPMSGALTIERDRVVFAPSYPLQPGTTYRAVFDPSWLKSNGFAELTKVEKDFQVPVAQPGEAARVTTILPSSDLLPENLLRLYLYFSAPMSRGEAYQRVHLIDGQGETIEFPFLELAEELWSPDGKRFTLYFDPGRIKRGLKPREQFGPALIEGGTYTLVVDSAWLDANGRPLKESFTKKFRVTAPDDIQPKPQLWKIAAPVVGTRKPVVVDLDEPLDSGMLQRVLEIRNSEGQVVPGDIRLANHERRWEFVPDQNWVAGSYRLIISTGLEDLAGNSIRRLFEIDILRPAVPGIESEVVELPFVVKQ